MTDWNNRIIDQGTADPNILMDNPRNWRRHPKNQEAALEGALDEIGWIQNVIVNKRTGRLIDGHLRVAVARKRGETEIPVLYVDLDENEEGIALASIDPIAALAETDQEYLDALINSLDVDSSELNDLLGELLADEEPEQGDGEGDDDAVPEPQANPVTRPGDIWQLGNHRVMCGDSTSPEAVAELLDGELADMVWTDPPYNVDYEGTAGKIQNDNMADNQFREFLRDAFSAACLNTREGGGIYIAHADSEGENFRGAMKEGGWLLKQCLIWVKSSFALGRQDYQWQHEPILYGWKPGSAHHWYGEFNKTTTIDEDLDIRNLGKTELKRYIKQLRNALNTSIIREDKPRKSEDHPTMKPVDLVAHMLRNSSRQGHKVLDLFGGSGSTVIACEKWKRHGRLMELDPIFVDVIVRRWERWTGGQATRASDGQAFGEAEAIARVEAA